MEELLLKLESHNRSKGSSEREFLKLKNLSFGDNQPFGETCLNAEKNQKRN